MKEQTTDACNSNQIHKMQIIVIFSFFLLFFIFNLESTFDITLRCVSLVVFIAINNERQKDNERTGSCTQRFLQKIFRSSSHTRLPRSIFFHQSYRCVMRLLLNQFIASNLNWSSSGSCLFQ